MDSDLEGVEQPPSPIHIIKEAAAARAAQHLPLYNFFLSNFFTFFRTCVEKPHGTSCHYLQINSQRRKKLRLPNEL